MKYKCDKCGAEYELTAEHIGVRLQCQCGREFTVSAGAAPAAEPVPVSTVNPNLIPCPDCGSMVSKKAPACPKCGRPFREAAAAPLAPSGGSSRPIRVDTGENVLNRNRGCADLLIYIPLLAIFLFLLFLAVKGCA